MKNWNEKIVAVVGLGRTGLSAVQFLRGLGAVVRVTDDASREKLGTAIEDATGLGAVFYEPGHRPAMWADAELCISSPGVPWHSPVLEEARQAGVEVVSELEFAARFAQGTILAVTGTNGKSTTTELIAHLLNSCGLESLAGGNLGRPLCSMLEEDGPEMHHVVECSSFQLQGCVSFRPRIALFLNFSPNHLDSHRSLSEYLEAKCNVFRWQTADDFLVFNSNDPSVRQAVRQARACLLPFNARPESQHATESGVRGLWVEGDSLWTDLGGTPRPWLLLDEIPLPGEHNVENVMAAAMAVFALGSPIDRVGAALASFRPLRHRMEPVVSARGISFVDDSKATNVEAVRSAVRSYGGGLHLILGGRDKGGDWASLREDLKSRAKGIYLIGESAGLIAQALDGVAPMQMCADMFDAVSLAWEAAEANDTVLLSPGCSSFDMFLSYEDRGDRFAEASRRVTNGDLTACNGGTA